ncbi:hypothetical protein BJ165DRAFT_1535574 [Panaeolus papilionaceus]|nr:hypothetical protein BJ165DRAFT_1535574 [Panaeolus papilionaceus]
MPARSAFQGSRAQFILDAKPEYAAGVIGGYAKDAVARIQRRYFKVYPIELPHEQEPSEEHLKNIDYDAPDEELEPPSPELLDDEEYQKQLALYEAHQRLIVYRKGSHRPVPSTSSNQQPGEL